MAVAGGATSAYQIQKIAENEVVIITSGMRQRSSMPKSVEDAISALNEQNETWIPASLTTQMRMLGWNIQTKGF